MLKFAKAFIVLATVVVFVLYGKLGYQYVVEGHGLHPAASALAIGVMGAICAFSRKWR